MTENSPVIRTDRLAKDHMCLTVFDPDMLNIKPTAFCFRELTAMTTVRVRNGSDFGGPGPTRAGLTRARVKPGPSRAGP